MEKLNMRKIAKNEENSKSGKMLRKCGKFFIRDFTKIWVKFQIWGFLNTKWGILNLNPIELGTSTVIFTLIILKLLWP